MTKCECCGGWIKDDTDDNYNADHSMILCVRCGHWQKVEVGEGTP